MSSTSQGHSKPVQKVNVTVARKGLDVCQCVRSGRLNTTLEVSPRKGCFEVLTPPIPVRVTSTFGLQSNTKGVSAVAQPRGWKIRLVESPPIQRGGVDHVVSCSVGREINKSVY